MPGQPICNSELLGKPLKRGNVFSSAHDIKMPFAVNGRERMQKIIRPFLVTNHYTANMQQPKRP